MTLSKDLSYRKGNPSLRLYFTTMFLKVNHIMQICSNFCKLHNIVKNISHLRNNIHK